MPYDFKKLHDEWSDAKKAAKSFHEFVAKFHKDVTEAHINVKIGLGPFPKFDLDLGPSLDKIHKGKDVAKAKKQAEKALKQYKKDIAGIVSVVDQLPPIAEGRPTEIQEGYKKYLPKFEDIRAKIEKAVDSVKE